MSIRDKVINYLVSHSEGVDDDSLSNALNLKHRQQANSTCRQLEKNGLVKRLYINRKINNFWVGNKNMNNILSINTAEKNNQEPDDKPWFWEGNVQQMVTSYLIKNGYSIKFVANTAERQKGKDIIAEKKDEELWITAKGYPKGTLKTRPTTQAGHWFKQAVFDIVDYRGQRSDVSLGIALPNFPRYHSLSKKTTWFKRIANFKFYWVDENGDVSKE